MPAPRFLGNSTLLGEPKPINWKGVGQALWDTNLNAPIRGVYNLMNADPYTLYTDEGAAGQQAVADSFDAAGGITVGGALIPKPSNALAMGIKAYHGSPHSFDKFSMDKIGTGEGAQAYGHGLYFAENEGVAKGYRDDLSSGTVLNVRPQNSAEEEVLSRIQKYSDEYGGVPEKATVYRDILNDYERAGEWVPAYEDMLNRAGGGSMYEVDINADPNAFLDWDKQLSEQPASVREALAAMDPDMYSPSGGDYDPSELGQITYQRLAAQKRDYGIDSGRNNLTTLGGAQAGATEDLKGFGIPGIKYLDAGSRGAGDGTRNYVVFDDKLISIVKKYGIAGASAMVGYNVLQGLDKAQAATLNKADLDHKYDQFLRSGGI